MQSVTSSSETTSTHTTTTVAVTASETQRQQHDESVIPPPIITTNTTTRVTVLPKVKATKKKKERQRTQSESAAWTRASFKMGGSPNKVVMAGGFTGSSSRSSSVASSNGGGQIKDSGTVGVAVNGIHPRGRNSESALPQLTEELLELNDRHSSPGLGLDDEPAHGVSRSYPESHDRTGIVAGLSREKCINMWLEQGQISERASEILEDAKLSLHGKEKNLYRSSLRRLSEAQDPMLNSLGEKLASSSKSNVSPLASTNELFSSEESNSSQAKTEASPEILSSEEEYQLDIDSTPRESDFDYFRPESGTLYHEAVKWEGVLSKRSEWLRRLEKHYYVLEGKYLRRFASKEAYIASRDEPLLRDSERPRRGSSPASAVSHLYILAGVKDSSTRTNGFTFITEDKKTLQLAAPTAVEKVIWMRLGLEAIVAIPSLAVTPLDVEEFYAMLVVLYTALRGNWKTEGDMAVTLPPPSEQVFTRFFRLLDKDIIFCSNYPPSVPFHGSFRGHAGLVNFIHEFAKHTIWTNFKIGGLSVEGSIAVASGKEELENKRDGRKFIQNWVHKFTFYSDGRLARFEINGDVVAASAVFKVPGAATTLKLPQDFNEVDAEHGLEGTLLVRVIQGNGIKMGTSQKKTVKEPSVTIALVHREKPLVKQESSSSGTSALGGLSMPQLTRKFSSGIGMLTAVANMTTSTTSPAAGVDPFSTGPPRNLAQPSYTATHPVWNKVISLPFNNVIGTCSLQIDVMDLVKGGSDVKIGFTSVNIAKYIMSAKPGRTQEEEEAAIASDSRWYTISNAKGEYCGKVLLGITCRRNDIDDTVNIQPRLKKSQSVVIDHHHPPTTQMLQWEPPVHPQHIGYAATPATNAYYSQDSRASNSVKSEEFISEYRRHGWANVKLSPETLARARSDGSAPPDANVHKRFPQTTSTDAVVCKENENMHTFMVCGAPFTVPKHYQLIKVCGRGAYGIVIAATDTISGGNVAIKKVIDCIWHPHQLKQILREARLIRHMSHENILSLMDLIPPPSYADFRDVYMTIDLMEMDLHRIIYSKEVLLDDHIRYFLYQILSGLSHMHKAGVLHRDLKPSNLLINSDCLLKICDLGLARSKEAEDVGMTEYVVTRWYRAPELLLGSAYGEGVDLWAAGCIFAEMLGRKPLFPGETYVHQLQLIMNVLGVPEEHSFKENPLANKLKGRQLLSRTQAVAGIDVSTMFPNANPEALDLLWKMLIFDVEKRITVEEALRHPYLAAYYDEERENRPVEKFQSFDLDDLDESDLKELMFKEICHFHPEEMEKRATQQLENPDAQEKLPPGWVKRESRSVPGKFYYSNPKRGISTWIKEEMD
ncbi:Cmgc/mapk protein kinase, partial [Globisporangium splendens]